MSRNKFAIIFNALCATLLLLGTAPVQGATVESVWLNPVDGQWTDGEKWSTSPVFPGSGFPAGTVYSAVIGASGAAYEVNFNATTLRLESLLIDTSDATLNLLSIARLEIMDSLHLNGGRIRVGYGPTAASAYLIFSDSYEGEIAGIGTIQFDAVANDQVIHSNGELKVAPEVTIETSRGRGAVFGSGLVNHGILRSLAGTRLEVAPNTFQNLGLIEVDGTTRIGKPGSSWSSSGTIKVGPAGQLELLGNFSGVDLETLEIADGGAVLIAGDVQNANHTMTIPASANTWDVTGTITGGRIEIQNGATFLVNGELRDVTLAGSAKVLFETGRRAGLSLAGSLTLDNGELVVPSDLQLYVDGSLELNGVGAIVFDGAGYSAALFHYPASGSVVVGEKVTIRTGPNGGGFIGGGDGPIINHGIISAETSGRFLAIHRPLTNHGTLQNKNQSDLIIHTPNWTNEGTILAIGPFSNQGFVTIEATQFANAESGLIGGTGRVVIPNTTLVNHGTIAPGLSIGTLMISGNVELTDTSMLDFEIGANGLSDRLVVQGNIELGGMFELTALPDFSLNDLNPITVLFTSGGIVQGQFDNVGPIRLRGHDFHIHYGITSVWLTPEVASVPEPAFVGSVAGLFVVAVIARRRRRHPNQR